MERTESGKIISQWRSIPPVWWVAGIAAIASLCFLLVGLTRSRQAAKPAPTASLTPSAKAVTSVSALGRLQPVGEVVKLTLPKSDFGTPRIAQLQVKEGQLVQVGQVLAVLDNRNQHLADVAEARAAITVAKAELAQVQAGAKPGALNAQRAEVKRLAAQLVIAERELTRQQNLFREGAVPASKLDQQKLEVEQLRGQLAEAGSSLTALAEVRSVDVRLAQAKLEQAQAAEQRTKADLENSVLRAPFSGRVLKVHTFPGETEGDDGVIELGRTNQMEVVAEVYETDVGRIRPGQTAIISSEHGGFQGSLQGSVSRVGYQIGKKDVLDTDPSADVDSRVVEVHIRLSPEDSYRVEKLTNLSVLVRIDVPVS
jgi:HlyD family secretion protein